MSEYHDWIFDTDSIVKNNNSKMQIIYSNLLKISNTSTLKSVVKLYKLYKIKNSPNLMYGIFFKKYNHLYNTNTVNNDSIKNTIKNIWNILKMHELKDFECLSNKNFSDISYFYRYCLECLK